MLRRILDEIENSKGSVSLKDLSRKMGIDQNLLEGMLELLVRQGRLQDSRQLMNSTPGNCSSGNCGSSCHGPQNCSIISKIPRAYMLASKK